MKIFINRQFSLNKTYTHKHPFKKKLQHLSQQVFSISYFPKKSFASDFHFESDIQKKLKEKFENKKSNKVENVAARYADIRFDVKSIINL